MNPHRTRIVEKGSGRDGAPDVRTAGVDNVTLNLGAGGDVVAADDIAGVKFQRIKLIYGSDNVSKGDVDTTNPLPVVISSDPAILSGRISFTGPVTDSAVVTPTSGKQLNITRVGVMADNDNIGKLTFRMGCGTTNTPTTGGVILSHPGLGNREFTVGNGRDRIGQGAVNQPLRITTLADAAAVYEVNYEYFES